MQGENAAIQFTGARSQCLGKLSDAAGLTARPEDPEDPAAPLGSAAPLAPGSPYVLYSQGTSQSPPRVYPVVQGSIRRRRTSVLL